MVKIICNRVNTRMNLNSCFSEIFKVTNGVHQESVLSLLLSAIAIEALSNDCCTCCPLRSYM